MKIVFPIFFREAELQSGDWFYSNVKKRFKRFGSAKVVRSLCKTKADCEYSGCSRDEVG